MPQNGVIINEKAYVLGQGLSQKSMEMRRAEETAARIISGSGVIIALLLFMAGVGLLVWEYGFETLFVSLFWTKPSFGMALVCASVLVGCFLFEHQTEVARKIEHMPKKMRTSKPPETVDVSGIQKPIDITRFFDPGSIKSLESAFHIATKFGHGAVEPLHIFIGCLEEDVVSILFARLGVSFEKLQDPLGRRLSTRQLGTLSGCSAESNDVLMQAFLGAYFQDRDEVGALELFAQAYVHDPFIQELLSDQNIDENQFANMVEWLRINEKMREQYARFQKAAAFKPTGPMNRAMTSVATPMLDAFSEDLTTAAVYGRLPMLIGRDQEIEEVFRVIEGGRESVVLVGPEGVGKGSVLAGIAQLMVEERVPDLLKDKRLVRLSIPHLISGVSAEVAQERMLLALDEVAKSRNIILAISDIEQMTGVSTGGSATADLAALLVDFLSRGSTFAIATTTPQAYTSNVERSVLGRIFQKVLVNEPEEKEAIHVLESKIGGIEYEQKVIFTYGAVEKAVMLSDRYMHEMYLPKKAIVIAKEVAQDVFKRKGEQGIVTAEDVAKIVSVKTGVPVTNVQEDEKQKLLHLEEEMHGRVIGQDEAVKAVAAALRRARADFRSSKRPIASFLFLGSTGVGKTELAKTLAATYFGSEQSMVRVDMSEYQDVRSMDRLIGAPGSNSGGIFSEAVRERPFSIVLLDELEKAAPDILNVFLQILDDGRVTDAAGRVIDFTNTIIIATSNAGTQYIQDAVQKGEAMEDIKTHLVEEELRGIYRPEFLNRFDGIVVFKPLAQEQIVEITKLMIKQVAKRLEAKGIGFDVTDAAVQELTQKGYDPKFGARPLRRVVQEEVDNAIANALLEGKVKRRDTIILDAGGQMRIQEGQAL